MIRPATRLDLPRCVELGRHFWASTGYATIISESPTQMLAIGERLVAGPDSVLLVSERDGIVEGMLGVMIFPHPLSGQRTAGEIFYWVEPEARGRGAWLLMGAQTWAKHRGAELMQMIEPVGVPEVGQLYQRLGYAEIERGWTRPL